MTSTIDTAFVKQFEAEVKEAYQRQGSKMRGTVRTINNVEGSTAIFQKIGKGTASGKTKNGLVPTMNLAHSNIEVTLSDSYAGDWIDKLDELKTNIDERQLIASAGAYALGRKTDQLIINAAMGASNAQLIVDANTGMTLTKVMNAFTKLGEADVPDDGDRFAFVGWKQWSEMLQIDEFSNSQYVGSSELPFEGVTQAKHWLGTIWMPHSGLTKDSSDIRSCLWWHKTALGHAIAAEVTADITWHGDRAAHFVNNMMSQGAGLIDETGVVIIDCDETPD